jgi:hypothetical protein
MEFAGSTAKPFTPSRWPPAELASGSTAPRTSAPSHYVGQTGDGQRHGNPPYEIRFRAERPIWHRDPVIACGARAVGRRGRQRSETAQRKPGRSMESLGESARAKCAPGRRPMVPCRRGH